MAHNANPKPRRAKPRKGGRRRAGKRREENRFAFVAASLACLAAALAIAAAAGLFRADPTGESSPDSVSAPRGAGPAPGGPVPGGQAPDVPAPAALLPQAAPPTEKAVGGVDDDASADVPATPTPKGAAPTASLPASARSRPEARSVGAAGRGAASGKLPGRPGPLGPARGTLIFVIDDAGYNMKELEAFLRLPFPLTVAVLPGLPYSERAARAVRAAGKELILHQPMEALGGQDPGPGTIRAGMNPAEARRIVESNLASLPGAVGMNNHMGSAVTTEPAIMEAVAAIAKKRRIYYLDSLTIPGTASQEAALREGIRYWERDVFLDNAPDRASLIRAVEDGKKHAEAGRPAVMIGHVWSAQLAQTIMDLYPQLVEEGYSLSTIARYMLSEASSDEDSGD